MKKENIFNEEDQQDCIYVPNMFSDFNELGNSSPFFIPLSNKNNNHLFDLGDDKSLEDEPFPHIIKLGDS